MRLVQGMTETQHSVAFLLPERDERDVEGAAAHRDVDVAPQRRCANMTHIVSSRSSRNAHLNRIFGWAFGLVCYTPEPTIRLT